MKVKKAKKESLDLEGLKKKLEKKAKRKAAEMDGDAMDFVTKPLVS